MLKNSLALEKVFFALVCCAVAPAFADESPDFEIQTNTGAILHIHSQLQPLSINQIHSWRLELSNESGVIVGASISVEGGMPEHDHGLPTQARVTAEISPGIYLLEGIRFHMPGAWQMVFSIEISGELTEAVLDFQL